MSEAFQAYPECKVPINSTHQSHTLKIKLTNYNKFKNLKISRFRFACHHILYFVLYILCSSTWVHNSIVFLEERPHIAESMGIWRGQNK